MASQRNVVQLVLQLKDELSRNADKMRGKMARLQRTFKAVAIAARGTGLAIIAVGMTFAVAAKKVIDFADDIGKTAKRMGIGVESLQEFRFAAEQAGVEVQLFDTAITALIRRAGEAIKGNKTFAKGFTDIGISIEELRSLKPEALILRVADGLSKIKDQNLKIAASDRIMSEAGRRVINVFDGGSEAMNRQREAARRLGIVLGEEFVEQAEKTQDELNILIKILKVNLARAILATIGLFRRLFNIGEIEKLRSELQKVEKTIRDLAAIEAKGPAVSVTQQLERARQRSLELQKRLFELEDPGRPPPSGPSIPARLSATIQKQLEEKKQAAIQLEEDIKQSLREIEEEHSGWLVDEYIRNQKIKRQIAEKARRDEKDARRRALDEEIEDERAVADIVATIKREEAREIEKINQAARDLGLRFQSMFEDAIIRGEKFSDLLKSLALDMARLALRKSVVEPLFGALANAAGSFFGGFKLPGFQFGGEVPGPIGRPQLAVVHGGEKITPASKSFNNQTTVNLTANFQITSLDPTTAAAVIQKNMPVISRSLIFEISRGGRLAAAVGRKQAGGI